MVKIGYTSKGIVLMGEQQVKKEDIPKLIEQLQESIEVLDTLYDD